MLSIKCHAMARRCYERRGGALDVIQKFGYSTTKGVPFFFFKSDCPPDEQTSEEIIATSISSTVPSTHLLQPSIAT